MPSPSAFSGCLEVFPNGFCQTAIRVCIWRLRSGWKQSSLFSEERG